MQPSPKAETSSPPRPSLRVFMSCIRRACRPATQEVERASMQTSLAAAGLAALSLLGGCASMWSSGTTERLPDGTYRLECKSSLARCLERAEDACHGARYQVLRAADERDYYGPEEAKSEVRSSSATIRCGSMGRPLFGGSDEPAPAPAAAPT